MRGKVAIVGPVDQAGRRILYEGLRDDFEIIEVSQKEEYDRLKDCSYVILRVLKMGKEDIENAPKLKLIQRWGAGYDSVDIETAGRRGVQVAVTSGINAIPVAEYAVLLILSVYRNLLAIDNNVHSGKWRNDEVIDRSYVIHGKTAGLIGLGHIGKEVAKKLRSFGAEVVYYDVCRLEEEKEKELGIAYMNFDALVRTADIISIHVPFMSQTKNMIDKTVLEKMKRTAVIINTARGGIINEQDLYEAIRDGKILGAGLDVFAKEPVSCDNPLLTLDQVVVSSHCAGNTVDNSKCMAKRCVENIRCVSRGGRIPLPDLVNDQYLSSI